MKVKGQFICREEASKAELERIIDGWVEAQRACFQDDHEEGPRDPREERPVGVLDAVEENSVSHNSSAEGLGYSRLGSIILGFVDEVNGPGGVEFGQYAPSRFEL